jgi:hypothetical protein
MELVAVTGISKIDDNTAAAQYTWRWKLSPLGSTVWASTPEVSGGGLGSVAQNPDAISSNEVSFRRFDDGWRLAN